MVFILSIMFFVSVVFLVLTVTSSKVDEVEARLRQIGYTPEGKVLSQEESELEKPFKERIIDPIIQRFSDATKKYAPAGLQSAVQHKLIKAGNPRNMKVNDFLMLKFGMTFGLPGIFIFLLVLAKSPINQIFMFGFFLFLFGFMGPDFWLGSLIKGRQKTIQRALPDVLDLLTVCVEAGLGFDSAMNKVVEKMAGPLTEEFKYALREMRMNKPRKDALRALADRVGVDDLTAFIVALIQADQLGVAIAKILRIQSEQMRVKRRQRAEEQAQKAAVKMIFPIAMCILPALFIVIFGPIGLQIKETMKGG